MQHFRHNRRRRGGACSRIGARNSITIRKVLPTQKLPYSLRIRQMKHMQHSPRYTSIRSTEIGREVENASLPITSRHHSRSIIIS